MSEWRWERRDRKKKAQKEQMPKHGRSLISDIEPAIAKKGKRKRKKNDIDAGV